MNSQRIPIIVGVGQLAQRWAGAEASREPLDLMIEASRLAIGDSGAGTRATAAIDAVHVVNVLTWGYRDAPGALAERLGIGPGQRCYTAIGGNSPQSLVNAAAKALEAGTVSAVLLAGAEAGYSLRRATSEGLDLGWNDAGDPQAVDGDRRLGANDDEIAAGLILPAYVYPLFETALRAASGRSPAEHAQFLGRLCERLSSVAAEHPCAWSQQPRSAAEISTPSAENRYVGYPYTKWMNANLNVDQAAALLLTTVEQARQMGIDREKWVYPMGGADLNDVWYVSQRPRLDRSPAIGHAARAALEQAGISLEQIGAFDLYSCFPSAVQMACSELGLEADDPRKLTVTGGLAYFGGCGNNYSMHAIATVAERIRDEPSLRALVSALGWYSTKHAVGIYGSSPPVHSWLEHDRRDLQQEIDASALPPALSEATGSINIEAFVVRHDRDNRPESATALGRMSSGDRVIATIEASVDELDTLETQELVGRRARCRVDSTSGITLARLGC